MPPLYVFSHMEKTVPLKCEAAICDASTYLQTIETFEKKYKVIHRIDSCSVQMMAAPGGKTQEIKIPGRPSIQMPAQQQMGVFIALLFVYEDPDPKPKLTVTS